MSETLRASLGNVGAWCAILLTLGAPVLPLVAGALRMARWRSWRWCYGVAAATTVVVLLGLHAVSLDGLDGTFFSLISVDGGEYAPQYSGFGFWRIAEGMTQSEVLSLVGPPLEEWRLPHEPDVVRWGWTRDPNSATHRIRSVAFRASRVVEKHAEYYVD